MKKVFLIFFSIILCSITSGYAQELKLETLYRQVEITDDVLMDIEGKPVDLKPMAKLKTVTRISARTSCLTSQIPIENFLSNITSFSSVSTESVYFSKKNLVSL